MTKILLRPVLEADLPILFEQQLDREAVAMADYPSKDKGEFMRHWEGILKNKATIARTIVYKDKVAGHILCWRKSMSKGSVIGSEENSGAGVSPARRWWNF